ncbi:uncharacterized protein GBIM_10962 [Gryllus bimaculatus]|nr:uncharacterized protein GBIM_10962 [Gryllus bimaculatus]
MNNFIVLDKILKELESVFDPKQPLELSLQKLSELKYLEMVVKESLRIYPPVPLFNRRNPEDTALVSGHVMPEGCSITLSPFGIHRDPEVFPEPEMFIPERFSPEESARRHPYAYIPFSAGPRNCIGQRFAMLELKSVLAKVVWNFRLLPAPDFEPELTWELTLQSANGIHGLEAFGMVRQQTGESRDGDMATGVGAHSIDTPRREVSRTLRVANTVFKTLEHEWRTYGNLYRAYIGPFLAVSTSRYQDHEKVFSANDYLTKGVIYFLLKPWLGDGLLMCKMALSSQNADAGVPLQDPGPVRARVQQQRGGVYSTAAQASGRTRRRHLAPLQAAHPRRHLRISTIIIERSMRPWLLPQQCFSV